QKKIENRQAKELKQDLLPGKSQALLTLANGKQIILDETAAGLLAVEGNAEIAKTENGQLQYRSLNTGDSQTVLYNTLSIPRGGQYQIVLPDGTKVWLNAASSIKYPTSFTGKQRIVQLEGEAYFEVA